MKDVFSAQRGCHRDTPDRHVQQRGVTVTPLPAEGGSMLLIKGMNVSARYLNQTVFIWRENGCNHYFPYACHKCQSEHPLFCFEHEAFCFSEVGCAALKGKMLLLKDKLSEV